MKRRRKIIRFSLISIVIVFTLTAWSNFNVKQKSRPFIFDKLENVQKCHVGLLLGTSRNIKNGAKNEFFFNRIDATVELFESGKINKIIISGDNSRVGYNEPRDMQIELVKLGIPDSLIYLDYAGFRTLDAIVRAKEVFGQSSFIVISQKFHNERAVFIARNFGIEAYGYNAKDVKSYGGFRTLLREFLARNKMFIDLFFGVKPKFLGERILID